MLTHSVFEPLRGTDRSYIRAFSDAKVAAPPRHDQDDDYVTHPEFRLLLVYLGLYATWYEVFMTIDGGTEGITVEDDHRLSVRTQPRPAAPTSSTQPCVSIAWLTGASLILVRTCGCVRVQRDEWVAALPYVREAGETWANSLALRNAVAEDFDSMDQNGGGYIDLQEFCEWAEQAEKTAGTEQGRDLGVNEPADHASVAGRNWHTSPLEMGAGMGRR